MGRAYAGVLGSLAFATLVARAVLIGGTPEETMKLAIVCVAGFGVIGWVAGEIAEQILLESVRTRFERDLRNRESETAERSAGSPAR